MSLLLTPEFVQLQQSLAGRFSLERELGRGGMGIVFLARDVRLERPVAIKLLPLVLAEQPDSRERFVREARTAARLSHPNIVPIHAVEERDDLVYFVMTFVDGETLGQRVRRAGRLTPSQTTRMVQEVAWALAYAHSRGVVHRDVKPDNILLDKDSGRAMVTDFGIAAVADTAGLSRSGEIVGTAHYMSPEQASGDDVDARTDLYSLGVTAFYALTGKLPFDGPNLPAIVSRIVTTEAPRVATLRAGVPVLLADAIDKCLAKTPRGRFANGEELAESVGAAIVATDVAPQVRFFMRAFGEADGALALLWLGGLLVVPQVWIALWPTEPSTVLRLVVLTAAPFVLVSMSVLHAVRHMIKGGFGPADVRRAFERDARARREEVASVFTVPPPSANEIATRGRRFMRVGHGAMVAGVGAILAGPVFGILDPNGFVVPVIAGLSITAAMVGYVGGFGVKSVLRAREEGKPVPTPGVGLTARLLGTKFVDWLFRVAGHGLAVRQQNAPPSRERTEVLVANAANDLFKRLPPDMRQRFAEVPRVVARLEADAALLRQRDAALAGVAPAKRDEPQLAVVRERLATAVAALENIRLDLLRLDAGAGSAEALTADLAQARAIGDAVDAEIRVKREVAALLAEPS
jgi:predicted Ser/Thr protein kinase